MKRIIYSLLTFVIMVSASAQEMQMPLVPLDPAVRRGTLSNGLTYYIRHNEWPEKRADFYIAQRVGSMQEEENQRGLAHFLEHMCFNGTTHFPGDALKQYLERIGVKFGENLNAYTSFDETVYNVNNVNVEMLGALDSCLLILHDWSHDLLLDDKEIDKERGVINEEWRMRRSAMMRMQEAAFHELYRGSKYADRMPIGTMDIVMNFPYEDLRAYYRRWYRPDLQAIVIVGDVDVDQMEQKIKSVFADIPAPSPEAPEREYFPVEDNVEPLVSIQKDKEQPASYAMLFFKTDPLPRQTRATMAGLLKDYVMNAISSMMAERIQDIVRQADAPFMNAYLSYGEYLVAKTKDAFDATVIMKDGRYLEGIAAMYRELLRASRFGFTEGEYDRFKQEYLSQLDAAYERRNKVENTSYVQEYVRHFLDGEPSPGIEYEHETMKSLVPQLPLQMINQTIAQLPATNRAIALYLPDKEGIEYPTEEQILKALQAVDEEQIEGLQEEVNNDPLVPELSSDVTVKKEGDDVYGAKLITLSNGIRVHVLKTDYAPNQISMRAVSWGGSSLYPDADYLLVDNAPMVSLGGWGSFTASQLQKRLAGIQASVSPTLNDRTEGLEGSCVKKDLETMMQLTYLCFTAPHRDDETYQSTLARLRDQLKNQDMNPRTALQDSIVSVVYNNDVRHKRMLVEDVDKLNYDRILDIYGQRFANAGDFEFFFVGDVDADTLRPMLCKYLGALPMQKGHEKYRKISSRIRRGEHTCLFEKEQDTPNSLTLFLFHQKMKDNLRNDIQLSMLEQAMQMLYTETVREDEGGAYSVGVSASLRDYPEAQGIMQIVLPTAPEKRDRMMEVIYQGVKRMCEEGPSEDNLQKIRQYMLRSHSENLKNNGYWMNQLLVRTRYGEDNVTSYEREVERVTIADLKKLACRLFNSGNKLVVGMTSPQK
ncbi:MAG: insulinase family protein [Bacteroidaceae bacterium]|nr:insulinase family protein [Bacteroidaceae bacterium]